MKTKLHKYWFDVSDETQAAEYAALVAKLSADKDRHFFNVISTRNDGKGECPAGEIELETDFLSSNQWNTVGVDGHNGYRVFDWYEGIVPNRSIKSGHYLEITAEMRDIRRNTLVCGYCGKHEPKASGKKMCDKCLGSEYLKQEDLFLLRLLPVATHNPKRKPLTEAERTSILPAFFEAVKAARTVRFQKRIADLREKVEADLAKALKERDGMIWLLERDYDTNNVIYYSHENVFQFGWRHPLTGSEVSKALDVVREFPFRYRIKGADPNDNGKVRTWENYE